MTNYIVFEVSGGEYSRPVKIFDREQAAQEYAATHGMAYTDVHMERGEWANVWRLLRV